MLYALQEVYDMVENTNNLADVADTGDELALNKALRHKLAKMIDESKSGRDVAALTRRLQQVAERIDYLEKAQKRTSKETPLSKILRDAKEV